MQPKYSHSRLRPDSEISCLVLAELGVGEEYLHEGPDICRSLRRGSHSAYISVRQTRANRLVDVHDVGLVVP